MKDPVPARFAIGLAVAMAALGAAAIMAGGMRSRAASCPRLERACLLAAGNARVHASWLEPGHRQRESALLLLSGDAAWAPVCAKDRKAADLLRDRILAETGTLNAPRASDLARELVDLLEKGQGR